MFCSGNRVGSIQEQGAMGGLVFFRAWVGSLSSLLPALRLPFLPPSHSGTCRNPALCSPISGPPSPAEVAFFPIPLLCFQLAGEGTTASKEGRRRREGKQVV